MQVAYCAIAAMMLSFWAVLAPVLTRMGGLALESVGPLLKIAAGTALSTSVVGVVFGTRVLLILNLLVQAILLLVLILLVREIRRSGRKNADRR
jgi:hypothetical protein